MKQMPISNYSSNEILNEAVEIRKLLDKYNPHFSKTWEAIKLEDTASSHLKAFWETIGWSEAFKKADICHPDITISKRIIKDTLKDYKSPLKYNNLPQPCRMVYQDNSGVGFSFTDESKGLADPEVMCIIQEKIGIKKEMPSYLSLISEVITDVAFKLCYKTYMQIEPVDLIIKSGDQPFPILVPNFIRLNDDLWILPDDYGITFIYKYFDDLTNWLIKSNFIKSAELDYLNTPALIDVNVDIDDFKKELCDYKSYQSIDGEESFSVGKIINWQVIVSKSYTGIKIHLNPRNKKDIIDHLSNNGNFVNGSINKIADISAEQLNILDSKEEFDNIDSAVQKFHHFLFDLSEECRLSDELNEVSCNIPKVIAKILSNTRKSSLTNWLYINQTDNIPKIRSIMEQWFWNPLSRDFWNHEENTDPISNKFLPKSFNLAAIPYNDQSSICITDESIDKTNPPIIKLNQDTPDFTLINRYSSDFIIGEIIDRLQVYNAQAYCDFKFNNETPYLEPLYNRVYEVSDKVWFIENKSKVRNKYMSNSIVFSLPEKYLQYLSTLSDDEIKYFHSIRLGISLELSNASKLNPKSSKIKEFRKYQFQKPGSTEEWCMFGYAKGIPVWISQKLSINGTKPVLICDKTSVDTVKEWIHGHGAKVFRESTDNLSNK